MMRYANYKSKYMKQPAIEIKLTFWQRLRNLIA